MEWRPGKDPSMSAVMEEIAAPPESGTVADLGMEAAGAEIQAENALAAATDVEALNAFLELVAAANAEYLAVEAPPESGSAVDWDGVQRLLSDSQSSLIAMQELLALALADLGVEDARSVRVYEDENGLLRLLSECPRKAEAEEALNARPEYAELKSLYRAVMAGMGFAGGLVGSGSLPDEVLDRLREKGAA